MSLTDWLHDTSARIRSDGIAGVTESSRELYIGGLRRINRVYPRGTNVYDRDWELLILLDGCRTDLIRSVEDEWSFLDQPGSLISVGSSSKQWLDRTFVDERRAQLEQTAYVTANPFTHRIPATDHLSTLDEVWRYGFDQEHGTIPARAVTERAISTARRGDPDRLIVHYMQPHFPSVPDPIGGELTEETLGEGAGWDSPWDSLRRGELEYERVWMSYRRNLQYVLEEVELLLQNVTADHAVISADHGNAAGEWGIYGHPRVPLRVIREVPWYRTEAVDEETFSPTLEPGIERHDLDDKLEALGYMG
jgi:hypothetical protein